jgi:hypothetical protein
LVPQSSNFDFNTPFGQPCAQPLQSQPWLGSNPSAQSRLGFLHPGSAMTADLKTAAHSGLLLTVPHLIDIEAADLKASRDCSWTIPAGQRAKHTIA